MKKVLSVLLGLFIICGTVVCADVNQTAEFLMKNAPSSAAVGGEWAVIGIARSEYADAAWLSQYETALKTRLDECGGVLSEYRYTEYARAALALTAIGIDASDFYGYDLISPLYEYDTVCAQGVNGASFALIALDSHSYDAPDGLREKYAGYITSCGFSDADRLAMAICAVERYTDTSGMRAQLDKMQLDTCEAAAQAAIVTGDASALSKYRLADGTYSHTEGGETNAMATEQAFYAEISLWRAENGKTALYDMTDVEISPRYAAEKAEAGKKDFSDISDSIYAEDIRTLAGAGVIHGISETEFAPAYTITRAEFAALLVRMLGLEPSAPAFIDVRPEEWYFSSVGAAYNAGIISGISETEFAPRAAVTRAQAAAMVYRAAGVEISDNEAKIYLGAFDDAENCPEYAKNAVGACIKNNAYPDCDMELAPSAPMRRDETAHMLAGMKKE